MKEQKRNSKKKQSKKSDKNSSDCSWMIPVTTMPMSCDGGGSCI